jgi:hypothetical protein
MVGNYISVVNILPVYVALNAKGASRHRTESLPETNPAQGCCLWPETPRALACGAAGSMTSHFDSGKPAFLPRLKSPISSEDFL